MDLDLLVGSGGVLSHAPRRQQAAMMLHRRVPAGGRDAAGRGLDLHDAAARRSGRGAHEKAATEVFEKDCLIHLGTLRRSGRHG